MNHECMSTGESFFFSFLVGGGEEIKVGLFILYTYMEYYLTYVLILSALFC